MAKLLKTEWPFAIQVKLQMPVMVNFRFKKILFIKNVQP